MNPDIKAVLARRRHKEISAEELFSGILKGDRTALARGITLVESSLPEHQGKAQELIQKCLPHSGASLRIGITGSPGAGKSSFIEEFGIYLIKEHNKKLAVLAIDPTSQRTKGSILGDKTRMNELSANTNAFIRPSPSGSSLGGVAQKTRESILLCEAAGYSIILIETVGVGQSEIAVHGMADFFLLLMLAGAGDELQGIKRGIMEMCDGMAITKCDGENVKKALAARSEYQGALHLFPATPYNWSPRVIATSAVTKEGLPETWNMICEFESIVKENGWFFQNRRQQQKNWMENAIRDSLICNFYNNPAVQKELPLAEKAVIEGKESPFKAADRLLKLI
uniref:Putative periplasmic protein kinase ArgK and related GTPases of G3E family n=1 Tax=uncultured bacterium contig00016 TaxID=1181507 RepID=A0A806JZX5_9BACT|nr:putative periplasmic protein kinase ArgK and related GTPases of G3E family [uncultured bacterium contig00016]